MSTAITTSPHEAWSRFIEGVEPDLQLVRPEVASSWERCRELRVNPFEEQEPTINQIELRERLYRKQLLMNVARPSMDNLYNFVRGSGFQVVLTDEHGFLLEVLGDSDIVSRTEQVHLCPGGNWSEAA